MGMNEKLIEMGEFIHKSLLNGSSKTNPAFDEAVLLFVCNSLALLKEQEAKHGEWIDIWREDDPDTSSHARCSVCNRISTRPVGAYCKWCGAKMDDEVEGR